MANITPIVRTHVNNITRRDIKYGWYPPHGLYVPARGKVVLDGDMMSLCKRDQDKKLLLNDLDNRRVKLALEIADRKGVAMHTGDKTINVKTKSSKIKEVEKEAVKEAQEEAKRNEEAQEEKLEKIETGEEPVEPYSETFQDKTIEEMKPPIQPMFEEVGEAEAKRRADVESVDLFGAEAFGETVEAEAPAKTEKKASSKKKGKMDPAKKEAMLAKRRATMAAKKAAAEQAEGGNLMSGPTVAESTVNFVSTE
jgi:hypothetical protein